MEFNMRHTFFLATICCWPFSAAMSQASSESVASMEAVGEYADATLAPIDLVQEDVSRQVRDYLNGPVAAKFAGPGVYMEGGTATVNVSTDHRDWAKHRVLAYKVAWAEVQENFIRTQMNEIGTDLFRKFYVDASGNVPAYIPESYTGSDAIDEFVDKSGAYLSSKLDAALTKIGVDPDKYSRGTTKQRTKQIEDAIRQESITQAVGKLTGLWPLMSFAGTVDDRHAIGVVGIYKPAFEEVASEIAKGRIPHASTTQNGPPISERIPEDEAALSNSFGTKLLRDENGYPALISFGQWSVTSTNPNPAIRAKFRAAAINQARSQADAEIALFLNGSANYQDRSLVGSVLNDFIDVDRSGYNVIGSEIEIQDVIDEVLKARGKVKLSGLRDLRTWTYRHPRTGHEIVGVVRVWTPADAMAAAAVRAGPGAGTASETESPGRPPVEEQAETYRSSEESPAYGDPNRW